MSKNAEDFFDLSAFDDNLRLQEEGIDVKIVGPNGKETDLVITVCGPDSSRAQAASQALQKEIEAEAAKEGNTDLNSPEDQRRRQISYLAKLTKGWNKPIGQDRLAFSEENAVAIYTKYPLIENQVRFTADRRSSFIKA
ncbi:hypothetical protein [Rhizobium leguminosarum]|uniref:hypothetical protein n=1 Tax=Rhizobium leguminosarum TaxID=384 RepID=UPI00037CEA2E|nr:hypothetical protein [Rhizobium leguminosarum]